MPQIAVAVIGKPSIADHYHMRSFNLWSSLVVRDRLSRHLIHALTAVFRVTLIARDNCSVVCLRHSVFPLQSHELECGPDPHLACVKGNYHGKISLDSSTIRPTTLMGCATKREAEHVCTVRVAGLNRERVVGFSHVVSSRSPKPNCSGARRSTNLAVDMMAQCVGTCF